MDDEAKQRIERALIKQWRREWAENPSDAFANRMFDLFAAASLARLAQRETQQQAHPLSLAFGFQVGLAVAVAFPEWVAAIVAKTDAYPEQTQRVWGRLIRLMPVEEVTEEQTG